MSEAFKAHLEYKAAEANLNRLIKEYADKNSGDIK